MYTCGAVLLFLFLFLLLMKFCCGKIFGVMHKCFFRLFLGESDEILDLSTYEAAYVTS